MLILKIFAGVCSAAVIGLGQIIKGNGRKGVQLLLLFYFVMPSLVYLSLLVVPSLFPYILGFSIIFAIILWSYNIFDAVVR
ncbi:MAG: hypothetical protein JW782_06440 [Candidatus Saganbacteria bacterium]|nr:hypothetical protein [Candidatus Saganbacteria bacterium]